MPEAIQFRVISKLLSRIRRIFIAPQFGTGELTFFGGECRGETDVLSRLPDASVSTDVLKNDLEGLARIGIGGFELVPFYLYGLPAGGQTPTDVSLGNSPVVQVDLIIADISVIFAD